MNKMDYNGSKFVPNIIMRHLIKTSVLAALLALPGFILVAGPALTNAPAPLVPGPNDGRIAYVTARLLDNYHYSQQPFDAEMSKKFFDGYLEALDPRRENFLQADIDGFVHYRTNLDQYTITTNNTANLKPAFEIYQRYTERLQQHNDYVAELLKENKFKFTGNDRLVKDRRESPYPKDLEEAKQLWRDGLRNQYLQEKLSRELVATNDTLVVVPLDEKTGREFSATNGTVATVSNNVPADIAETLARHYRWNFHMATNRDSTDVLQAYLEALAHAYDPHSDYFNTEHAQDFSINMSLSLFGIGAQLVEDDGYCTISKLIRGGPADKSKEVSEKDRIIAVAQGNKPPVNVVDMDLTKVVQLIRGPKGTEVRLTISPADDRAAREVVTLVRDEIKLEDQEAKATLIEMPDGHGSTNRLGVIDLPSFYATIDLPGSDGHSSKSTTADVAKLIKKLKEEKANGIILDLRNNPGGSLEEAVKFTGLFIKDGPVVLARAPDGNVSMRADTDSSVLYDGPLAVLINRFSASAAEIAAAALQDYGRAVVVGDTSTHGKGTVQNLNPLKPFVWPATASATNDPGTVKITIQKFYRVSGASTQLKGVVPDIVLPDVLNYLADIGETSLENPLPWDTIPREVYDKLNLVYNKLNLVDPYVAALHQSSEARISTNQDFAYINEDIQQYKKLQAEKTVSLNEKMLIKERQVNQARQKARDKEREARPVPAVKIYEITVKNSDLPGLPEPMDLAAYNAVKDMPAGSTNAVKSAAAVRKKSQPPLDPMLNETANILEDYIAALSANHILIAQ
ncbi:MAG: carboxy terminal-processing peptidase [Limisphaerales bacterium]